MSNDKPLEHEGADTSGLEELPESERAETEEIIEEAAQDEEKEKGSEEPEKPEGEEGKEGEEKSDPEKPEKPEEDKGDDPEPPKPRAKSKLMPSWVHETAIKQKDTIIENLTKKLEDAQSGGGEPGKPGEDKTETVSPQREEELNAEVKKIAEEHNLDADLVKGIVDLGMRFGGKLPAEVSEQLEALQTVRETVETQAEEQAFNKAFDDEVLPLIKAEYGDEVASDTIEEIREQMKATAYTPEYQQTPYPVIYKGLDAFRKFTRPSAAAGEESRGGFQHNGGEGEDAEMDFSNVTESDIADMDEETFDKYTKWAEAQERSGSSA